MTFSPEKLADIVARASTIYERLDQNIYQPLPPTNEDEQKAVLSRLTDWERIVAPNISANFQKRLQWGGFDDPRLVLGQIKLNPKAQLPDWVEWLQKGLQFFTPQFWHHVKETSHPLQNKEQPTPFEHLLLPFVDVALEVVKHKAHQSYLNLLSDEAKCQIGHSLVERLFGVCGHVFQYEFTLFKMGKPNNGGLYSFLKSPQIGQGNLYDQFVEEMYKGGIQDIFDKYPVLARFTGLSMMYWANNTIDFLNHLEADWLEIEKIFADSQVLTHVKQLNLDLSDPHHNGRTVISVCFNQDIKVIYKPKALELDRLYFQLLDWITANGFEYDFKTFKLLIKKDHSWVEFVAQQPCDSFEQIARYYQRAGALLCLWYVLNGTDCHNENLIAYGEYPTIIDLETLMCPQPRPFGLEQSPVYDKLWNSVMATSMLPYWHISGNGQSMDLSALGQFEGIQVVASTEWVQVNQSGMAIKSGTRKAKPSQNVPYLKNEVAFAGNYVDDIIAGFELMYKFLTLQQNNLLTSGLIEGLSKQLVRYIFRPTDLYGTIMRQILQPAYLKNGADASIKLDSLSRVFLLENEKPAQWAVLQTEVQSILNRDVPFFMAHPQNDHLYLNQQASIPLFFVEPSYQSISSRIRQLSKAECLAQIGLIKTSFQTLQASKNITITNKNHKKFQLRPSDVAPLSTSELISEAERIAEFLKEKSTFNANGDTIWAGLKYHFEANRYQIDQIGYDFYDGNFGIGLFYAALDHIRDTKEYHSFVLDHVLQPFRRYLNASNQQEKDALVRAVHRLKIGGALGIGSLAYVLTQISLLLNEPILLQEAVQTALLITPDKIKTDPHLDVLMGTAGALLSILKVYEQTKDNRLLERAILCGDSLVERQVKADKGVAWPIMNGKLLTGFSHGTAGIAYALFKLAHCTQNSLYHDVAIQAIEYENSTFSPEAGNWADLRGTESPNLYDTIRWCTGAPGIGLGRILCLPFYDTPEMQQDIDRAIAITTKVNVHTTDHLCCGNLGRNEFLWLAAKLRQNSQLQQEVLQRTSWIVKRREVESQYNMSLFFEEEMHHPGFFQGLAGVGYSLLRMVKSDQLPLVIGWV